MSRPNLLVVMADQHAARFCGAYGHPLVQTPHLDGLAAGGVLFDAAYTLSPICVPERMGFMTGRHVQHTGIWDNGVPLREDTPTWAHRVRAAGYRAALAGKMHFRGFDQLHGFEAQLAVDINARNQPQPPDWSRPLPERPPWRAHRELGAGRTEETDAGEAVTAATIDYIRDRAASDTPWALVAGFVAPHNPFVAPREFIERYQPAGVDLPPLPAGRRVATPVSLVDLTATLIDAGGAAGHPHLPRLDGASLRPLLTDPDAAWRRDVRCEHYANFSTAPQAMLRRGRHKLIHYHDAPLALYDLEADPEELDDLAGSSAQAPIRDELQAALLAEWDPVALERRIITSQRVRRFLAPYLFGYLDRGPGKA